MSKTTNWAFTINNYTEEDIQIVQQWDTKYTVYGKEVGEEGTPHLQGYVNLQAQQRLSYMKKLHPTAHWEQCKGTPEQNIVYCKKQGNFWENGTPPQERHKKGTMAGGKRTRENWDEILELAKSGRIEEIDSEIQIKHYSTLRSIQKDYGKRPADMEVDSGWKGILWIYGRPGTGKSRYVRDTWTTDEIYDKSLNKWWDGYKGEKIALLDDFDKNHKVLGSHLKRWGDRYAFPAEIKGGKIDIRPERIVVTSNYMPDTIWHDDNEMLEAIMRRTEMKFM